MARTLDAAKREAILAAARNIFIKDGYAETKMSDVAAEVGVAQGTLYLYFESKEALAGAIGEEFFSRLITQFGDMVRKIEDPEGIVALVDWAARTAYQDRVVLAMAKERHHGGNSKREARQSLVSELADALAGLIERGVIRRYGNPVILAEMVLAMMRRIIMSQAIYEDDNVDALKAGAVVILQHALFDDVALAANDLLKRKQNGEA